MITLLGRLHTDSVKPETLNEVARQLTATARNVLTRSSVAAKGISCPPLGAKKKNDAKE